MKKLLVIALLMLALVITAVACRGTLDEPEFDPFEDTTTEASTQALDTSDESREAPTEEATEAPATEAPNTEPETDEPETPAPETEPPVDPADPVLMLDPETLNTLAGAAAPNVFQLGSTEVITEGNNTFVRWTAAGGDPYVAIIPLGSSYTLPRYMAIRYRTNSAAEGQFFVGSGACWTGIGDSFKVTWTEGDWSFVIVDLTQTGVTSVIDGLLTYARMDFFDGDSAKGDYFDVAYVAFFNTAEYAMAYDFENYPPYVEVDDPAAGKKNHSVDTFYLNGQMYFPEDGGADAKLDAINNTLTFASAAELENIKLRGWIGFDQPIDTFGYYVDNYEFVYGEFKTPTESGVLAAGGEFASRFEIFVDLSYLEGDDHFVGFVVKLEDGTVVRLREEIIIDLPEDITDTFTADVNANEVGTTMDASDLANFFVTELPLSGSGVKANGEGKLYHLTSINDMYADVNGRYFFKANVLDSNGAGWMFVRGYKVVNSDAIIEAPNGTGGFYRINNYYETDGAGAMGGAGIYARLQGGQLSLMIKYYNAENVTRVGNKMITIDAPGTELTLADNGSTVSILVDGVTYATIDLTGSKAYEDINEVDPAGEFAATAVITLKDGTTETIENTLIAATCEAQIGIVSRAGSFKFDALAVGAYSAIDVPALEIVVPEEPEFYENLVVPQDVWTVSGYCTGIISSTGHPNSSVVAAAGVESAALLHQGSIGLGNINLSKYSKVIVMWGCDNSEVTINRYNANANNRIMLLNAEMSMVMSPAEGTIIAGGTYELKGWKVTAFEIDLTDVNYNGPVWLAIDTLPGTHVVIASVEFIGGEIDHNHRHSYETIVTAPTCTEGGYTTYTCACGDTYVADKVPTIAHSYETIVTAPTCTESGYTTYTCACGHSYTDNIVEAVGHNFVDGFCGICGEADPDVETPDEPDAPVAGGAADFNTIVTSNPNGNSSYTGPYTTTDGWVINNSAIQAGGSADINPQFTVIGPDNTFKAPCLNGKVSAPGSIESPVLSGGISKLVINYTKIFTDTKLGATITITDIATGAVYTKTLTKEAPKEEKYTVWTFGWVLETPITGDFTIEIVNNSPSAATNNKDRLTILSLTWEGAAAEEPETPVEPEIPAVENYLVPQSQWVITGHNTQLNDDSNPMVAAGGIESAALLHQGSIGLGNIDLSKYSKAVVMWGCDNSWVTIDHYNANANNRIMLLNAEMSMVMSPAEGTIIAGGTYELKGWKVTAFEIDLTGIDYNGPVWLAVDTLPGTFAMVASVEFIA